MSNTTAGAVIDEVALHLLELEYGDRVVPYEWSGGVDRRFFTVLAEARSERQAGWGEGGFFVEGDALSETPALLETWFGPATRSVLGAPVGAYRQLGSRLTSTMLPAPLSDASVEYHPWEMARSGALLWEPAAVALQMALWDLFAREANVPLSGLFGAGSRRTVPMTPCIGAYDPARVRRIAASFAAAGFRSIKLKGGRGIHLDAELVSAARSVVDDDVGIRLDANGAYDVGEARRLSALVAELGIEYLEEPCAFQHLRSVAAVRRSSAVPIALDEAVLGPTRVLEIHEADAADVVMLEFHQVGGVEPLLRCAAVADACGLPLGLHTSYVTGIRSAAVLHLAAALPNLRYAPDTLYHDLRSDVLATPLRFDGGSIAVPTGAGLGVEVDRDAVRAHALVTLARDRDGRFDAPSVRGSRS